MKTVVIVQARMTSRRFPGKSMALLFGRPVLQHVLERCKEIGPEVILACPDEPQSRPMVDLASKMGVCFYLGDREDVLSRYYHAAIAAKADVIMRITGDCPFIEPDVCRATLERYYETGWDYLSNCWPNRRFPSGLDCEVFSRELLEKANQDADCSSFREHVTPWMQTFSKDFRNIAAYTGDNPDESNMNWCVDVPEDIERLSLRLVNVYRIRRAADTLLYRLMEERDATVNISHRGLPDWEDHVEFVDSCPYERWYIIAADGNNVGAIYLTERNEIGVGILKEYQGKGYGKRAVKMLMDICGHRKYLANINPANERSKKFFAGLGFTHLQETYQYVQ